MPMFHIAECSGVKIVTAKMGAKYRDAQNLLKRPHTLRLAARWGRLHDL